MRRQSGNKGCGVRPSEPPFKDRAPAGHFERRAAAGLPLTESVRSGRYIERRAATVSGPSTGRPLSPAETPLDLDDPDAAWGAMKLRPEHTGLPMAVWITPNDGYQHDVRVKVSRLYGGGGSWTRDAVQVGVRPQPHEIVPGSLSAADAALVRRWIELNHQLIVDVWDGRVDAVAEEVYPLLHKLPP